MSFQMSKLVFMILKARNYMYLFSIPHNLLVWVEQKTLLPVLKQKLIYFK